MSNQLIEDGKVVEINGTDFECTGVSYQETPEGERHTFAYTFRLKSDVDSEREAEAAHQEQLRLEAEGAEAPEEVAAEPEQPKPLEEETQHVR